MTMAHKTSILKLERLEKRHLLTTLADIDSDGDLDAVTGDAWHENYDGYGNFRQLPFSHPHVLHAVGDVDGDRDLDVVFPTMWLENADGKGDFSVSHRMTAGGDFNAARIKLTDVGADGDLDVVLFQGERFVFFDNADGLGDMRRTAEVEITDLVDVGDLDNDGDLDAIALEKSNVNTIWLHRNLGQNEFVKTLLVRDLDPNEHPDSANFIPSTYRVEIADLDGDGVQDIVSQSAADGFNYLNVIKDDGGDGHITTETVRSCFSGCPFELIDFDFDGDLDVLQDDSGTATHLVRNDNGVFHRVGAVGSTGPAAGDINGDGAIDLIGNRDEWYDGATGRLHSPGSVPEMPLGTAISFLRHTSTSNWSRQSEILDFDQDGDQDFIMARDEEIVLMENSDHRFNAPKTIVNFDDPLEWLDSQDVDNDGDTDIMGADRHHIFWVENNGQGSFLTDHKRTIFTPPARQRPRYVEVGDVDQDGRLDLVYASRGAGVFGGSSLFVLTNNGENFSATRIGSPHTVSALDLVDVDTDGDLDILTATGDWGEGNERVYQSIWYENLDSSFGTPQVIDGLNHQIENFVLADLNGDDQLDLIWHHRRQHLRWRDGIFGELKPILANQARDYEVAAALDFDNDGDVDVVASNRIHVVWFENIDGLGRFSEPKTIIVDPAGVHTLHLSDFDGDGDIDILNFGSSIDLYEARLTGDVNGDGVFDSKDLVQVFQHGEFEDGIYRNSIFANGDWNGDREFDSKDLLFAVQAGLYINN